MKQPIINLLACISLLITPVFFQHQVLAISPTASPSAKPTEATVTPSQTQDIQEKIKALVSEKVSADEASLREQINQRTLVGYVGYIKSINTDNLTLSTKDNSLLQITTDINAVITKKGAVSKISSLALSDKVIVIGTRLKADIVLAKRITVIADEPVLITSSTIVAKISSIDIKKKTITLIVNDQKVVYGLTRKSTVKPEDLNPGETILAISKKYEGKDLLSRAKVL